MTANPGRPTRTEHDSLGAIEVPAEAYYGAHTARAVVNFPISGTPIGATPHLIRALAMVKLAAATANRELGLLAEGKASAIVRACEDIIAGDLHEQFAVDSIQGGAGTSTNMNANEVIANRALEHLGQPRGHYAAVHPLDDVNLGQSTNDVYPTAVKLALHWSATELIHALGELREAFTAKAAEFHHMTKIGRTQLQDAVPMTLGQEFGAFGITIGEDEQRLDEARQLLHELNLGGTAIGTRLNAAPGYQELATEVLRARTGITTLASAPDLVESTSDTGAFVQLSGVVKRVAVKLSKICNDLRLLSSGPLAGLGEINLPPVQAGSSIMPGKVNPVIPEVVNQIAFEVIGHDVTTTMAGEAGQLQLNAFEPIIARSLFHSIEHLTAGCQVLTTRCVRGITANAELLRTRVDGSIGLATALNPAIGYVQAASIAKEALKTGKGVVDLVRDRGLVPEAELIRMLAPERLTGTTSIAGGTP
ncbi:aspartate ammonia-lyase [Saccharopolyspora sp. 5N102]|uniref:aspartate ammonia-lyase n=1 Tax=Saccharopolyspora sp. 5N102 TaxID=3375155 RepID=UPI0037AD4BF7